MTKVADKTLAEYVKFQHDMLERVLKGSVNSIELMNVQRSLIGQKTNPYLRLISGGHHTVTISACKGGKKANLYKARETFPGYIDSDFKAFGVNLPQPATEEIAVDVHKMYNKDANFKTLFGSLCPGLVRRYSYDNLLSANIDEVKASLKKNNKVFESQEQIEKFAQENKQWLPKGSGTFFLFTEEVDGEEKFFVVGMFFGFDELLYVYHLSYYDKWLARFTPHIVVPQS